ncbi:hypothetical protein K431DRAFT_287518 [Polychaeton citri CBS 116435]|uniref:Zn(2)-C6 fungal-type domain-containing protein n=1 Tax=Polychaeton citri CBS 116435 TaxID=1314669 RepID=A0A9P4UMR3_9PEZI|nr:hypothetical protein K431DRAFT_287518 [Polychaeton citri CBS 116435]
MAEYLLKSVSEAGSVQQDADASPANEELNLDSDTQRGISRARRSQVSAACQSCRQRKIKCDALRPCRPCVKRNLTCRYDTQHGETHSQAFKRKYEDAIHSHDTYAEVFYILRSRSEQDAAEVLRWIRSGRSPEVVLRFMTSGDFAHITPNPGPFVLDDFLVNLAHSTGSAQDIIRLATITLDPSTKVRLPRPQDFFELRNRIVQIQFVEKLLQRSYTPSTGLHPLLLGSAPALSRGDAQSGVGVQSDLLIHDDMGRDDHPPHHVPAAPWTTITASDEAVSHLVSLFLAWINPTWRFVEQDLFLMGMRSKRLQSRFCSPLLVNSICAIASLQSEHEVAMVPGDRNRITRGQHFHDEALHLWALEENRPTLTNIQALCQITERRIDSD